MLQTLPRARNVIEPAAGTCLRRTLYARAGFTVGSGDKSAVSPRKHHVRSPRIQGRMTRLRPIPFLLACGLPLTASLAASAADAPDAAGVEFFEKHIRPVLGEKCYQCHSAEAASNKKLKGDLLLDT